MHSISSDFTLALFGNLLLFMSFCSTMIRVQETNVRKDTALAQGTQQMDCDSVPFHKKRLHFHNLALRNRQLETTPACFLESSLMWLFPELSTFLHPLQMESVPQLLFIGLETKFFKSTCRWPCLKLPQFLPHSHQVLGRLGSLLLLSSVEWA